MKQLLLLVCILTFSYSQSLDSLFAQPTQEEKESVLSNWNARDLDVYSWTLEGEYSFNGLQVHLVSHDVQGNKHYGIVRLPKEYDESKEYRVLLYNHWGMNGIPNLENELRNFGSGDYQNYIVVMPSFCGETIKSQWGNWTSEGNKSEFDIDVDNGLALLNGVLENYAATTTGMMVTGMSRGSGVTYLMMARDSRFDRAVTFYGGVDHMTLPGLKQDIENSASGPFYNTVRTFSNPYMSGSMTLQEARLQLLLRSPIHFIDRFPAHIQIHHGDQDPMVPVINSQHLDSLLKEAALPTGDYAYYEYAGVGHSPTSEAIQRRNEFLSFDSTITSLISPNKEQLSPINMVHTDKGVIFSELDEAVVTVYTTNGRLLRRVHLTNSSVNLPLGHGMYLMTIHVGEVQKVYGFIVN